MLTKTLSKKRLFTFVFFCHLLYVGLDAQIIKDYNDFIDREYINLKGTVKSIHEFTQNFKALCEECHDGWAETIVTYDKNGKISSKLDYENSKVLIRSRIVIYDDKGNQIEKCLYYRGKTVSFKYNYDSTGNLIQELQVYHDDEPPSAITNYDAYGNITDYKWFNNDGSLKQSMTSKIDKNHHVIEEIITKADSSLDSRRVYNYDTAGRIIGETLINTDGRPPFKTEYHWDSKNNLIDTGYFMQGGKMIVEKTDKADSALRPLENILYGNGVPGTKVVCKYDANGNRVEITTYNYGSRTEYQTQSVYKFDKTGNWIKKVDRNLVGEKTSISKRVIEYY